MKTSLTHHLLAALLGVAFTTTLHAQLVVTTSVDEDNGDANPGTGGGTGTSLREAVNYASPGDTITFTNTLSGATLVLTSGQITISTNLAVDASSLADGISVSGNNSSRVVLVPSGVTASLTGLTIRDGAAAGGGIGGYGGGILNQGTLTLTNCTLTSNSAAVNGGGLANDSGSVATVMACTFSTNTASAVGGGVHSAGDATIIQSTFGGNSAAGAGGGAVNAHASSVSLVLDGCTISGNSATNGSGGGVRRAGGTVTITNSIVAGNTASTGDDLSGLTTTGPNLIGGDPMLAPFGDYGGPTRTMPPLPGSPAIDGATNGTAYAVDQRGLPRFVGAFADLGAVESGQAIPTVDYTVVTTADDFLSEWADSGVSLRSAVAFADNDAMITFTNSLSGQTLLLTSGQITVDKNLTIDGSALAGGIAIDGNASNRVFQVNSGTTVVLDSLTITNGKAVGNSDGGGIYNNGADLTINTSTLSGNTANNGNGGGILNYSGTVTINTSTLSGNTAHSSGGGIHNFMGTVTVNNSTLSGNTANNGGGILNGRGTVTLNNSTLSGNTAGSGGGGIRNFMGTVTVNNSTLSGNTANYGGGGIWSDTDLASNKTTVINSTFHNNSASSRGGGFYNYAGLSKLFHSTFTGNTAPAGEGSGVASRGDTLLFETVVQDCIIAENTNSDVDLVNGITNNTFTSLGYNLIGTGSALASFNQSGDQTNAVAQLAPLGDYGGPTQTMPPLPGSLAIDAGLSTTNTPATDQRGFARVVNGTLDIGAVEVNNVVTAQEDSVAGSLREIVLGASPGATITFDPALSGQTLPITNGNVAIERNLTIDASALPGGVILDGMTSNRVLSCGAGTTNTFIGLTIVGGVGDSGAGIRNSGVLTVDQCTISSNSASGYGGGIYHSQLFAALTVQNSTLSGNTADAGGGIFGVIFSSVVFQNSTLSGNTANAGGGIVGDDGATLTVQNSTLSGNTANSQGGGIFKIGGGAMNLENSIVAGNSAPTGTNISGTVSSSTGVNLTNGTPQLAPLGNYGGPTQTMPPLPGSPAIDAGLSTANTPATDQRGFTRVSGTLDIGAVEGVYNPAGPGTLTDVTKLGDGSLQFGFTNYSGMPYTVLASTNVAAPLNTWSNLGPAVEAPPGTFQFTDPEATNYMQRYYRVQGP